MLAMDYRSRHYARYTYKMKLAACHACIRSRDLAGLLRAVLQAWLKVGRDQVIKRLLGGIAICTSTPDPCISSEHGV